MSNQVFYIDANNYSMVETKNLFRNKKRWNKCNNCEVAFKMKYEKIP